MDKRQCANCGYFMPALACIEKPTWGHCSWPRQSQRGGKEPKALFTWADDMCAHFTYPRESAVQRDFSHNSDLLT